MIDKKPKVKLVGADGNVFNLIGLAAKALKQAGMLQEAKAFQQEAFQCQSYGEVLCLIGRYCEVC